MVLILVLFYHLRISIVIQIIPWLMGRKLCISFTSSLKPLISFLFRFLKDGDTQAWFAHSQRGIDLEIKKDM